MSNEVQIYQPKQLSAFAELGAFELAQRQAKLLADSDLVPATYRGKIANCVVALDVAQRCGASVMAVMQNMHVIHGRPSWSSSYIIAAVNSSGRFGPLRFKVTGEGDQKACIAWTHDKDGEVLEGPPVSIAMAKAEGWWSRKDREGRETSKWQTMPDLMLRYRAAAFFGRLYAPEILLGMRTDDEERDIIDITPEPNPAANAAAAVNEKVRNRRGGKTAAATVVEPATTPPASVTDPAPAPTVAPTTAAQSATGGHF